VSWQSASFPIDLTWQGVQYHLDASRTLTATQEVTP
jgi:hypothetical protein